MAKRNRWQPPHLDPAKQARADEHAEKVADTLRDSLLVMVACIVPGCTRSADLPAAKRGIGLCEAHARDIALTYPPKMVCHTCESNHAADERRAAEREAKRRELGTIYYVGIDGEIKIGWTGDLAQRMRAYPPSAKLLATEPGTKAGERARHSQFNEYLAHGREWFSAGMFLLEHINEMVDTHGEPPTIVTLSTPIDAQIPGTTKVKGTAYRRREHDGSAAIKRHAA